MYTSKDAFRRLMNYALGLSRRVHELQERADKKDYQMGLVYQIAERQTEILAELEARLDVLENKDIDLTPSISLEDCCNRIVDRDDPKTYTSSWESGCYPRPYRPETTTYGSLARR